jgi:Ca2+-transporting ATPase
MGGSTDEQLAYYRLGSEAVLSKLETRSSGLTGAEAMERLTVYGANHLTQSYKESWMHTYLRQFKDLMIVLLLVSGVIALVLGDKRTALVLVGLVFFNTAIGFFQEFKAERLMESLERLVVPLAKARRDGKLEELASTDLVPGDVIYLQEGDSVPADIRLIEETEFSTNDFALTGESNPSRKFTHAIAGHVELGNRHNLAFMGTTVATGQAYGVVIATGMQSELGRIASLSAETVSEPSPLQRELANVATRVTQGTVILCIILLFVAIQADLAFKDAFLFAIGIASSLIPQGLPAEINTSLAQAANKLVKARALVKKLSAVETLGATTIICTDKTGTLTQNQMTVEQVLVGHTVYTVSGGGYEPKGNILGNDGKPLNGPVLTDLELFFATGAFASNAHVSPPDDDHPVWYALGDPTEAAIITLAGKAGLDAVQLDNDHPELKEFPFDSARKRMTSIRTYGSGKQLFVFVKGAPENVLEKCTDLWDHGHVRTLKAADKKFLTTQHETWAGQAMRNLGLAYKVLPAHTDVSSLTMDDVESGLTFLGLASMIDPLREEVPAAMLAARAAHIKISIVTGDYALTAKAIAVKAKLADHADDLTVVSGEELRQLDDAQVLQLVLKGGTIFSRVAPEDKLRIVELVKHGGQVVAVTGDGINDAPALKRADIGVAMGKTGTDVAKQSAEIVLLDDSFSTLVGAIEQGRTIFHNIKKGTLSCFTSNAAELIVNLTSLACLSLFHIPLAMSVMQILAVDLIAELFPIAALGWDKAEGDIMHEPPRRLDDHILNSRAIRNLLWCGLLIGTFAFLNYLLFFARQGLSASDIQAGSLLHWKATTLTYLTIVLCQLGNILQRRSSRGLFTRYQLHNRNLWLAMTFSMFCVINIIYNPWIAPYFTSAALSLTDWLYALGAAALFLGIREIQRHANTHHRPDDIIELHRQTFGVQES